MIQKTRNRIALAMMTVMLMLATTPATMAQKFDEQRMTRDIAVGENVLSTLIKQQFNNQRTFFQLEVNGSYQEGYGVTFTLPADFTTPIAFMNTDMNNRAMTIYGNNGADVQVFGDDFGIRGEDNDENAANTADNRIRLEDKATKKNNADMDSIRDAYNDKVIEASKTFILDYGDMIAQLAPTERVVVSNQGNSPRMWVNQFFNAPNRTHLSVEATKADITAYRTGKLTREQALAKMKVVNTETVEEVAPDLELLSSIFSRLYSPDLSKTYFTQDNVYFERLKDFGVIFYMQAYSGIERERDSHRYIMPTQGLNDVDQETRDKKAKEIYPKFEQELKDNILEYGRTLKSLKDEEVLVFQVKVTRCNKCNIPSSLEYSLKASVLKDFNAGKIDRNAAMSKFNVKKGANQ
ncbi:hypothetical protein [Chryseolinea lacunae]|uniref:Uncharacterized protein n=1 Tax=Chryseolinea lacunae TaxID=2801331 RepID=A0ABS1KW94_9BACT|nr:hypothetical protein [Chryseolinea lacunae]MBL0742957.1 hypothetical protein [Chryseolinea lacunae]